MNRAPANQRDIIEQAADWVTELKRPTQEERAAFGAWLTESPRHVEEFLLAAALDRELEGIDAAHAVDVEDIVAAIIKRGESDNVVALDERPFATGSSRRANSLAAGSPQSYQRYRRVGIAACVILAVTALALTARQWSPHSSTYSTAIGEQRALALPDGSVVNLNTQSRIVVNFSERERRVYLLSGEALFKVAKAVTRPFRVAANNNIIQAIGTQFDVYRKSRGVTVAVLEGKVQVSGERRQSAPLSAGEEAQIETDGQIVKHPSANLGKIAAWQQRRLVFLDDSLQTVVAEFNRYNQQPQVKVEGAAAQTAISGVFDADNPQALILFLKTQPELVISKKGADIVIK